MFSKRVLKPAQASHSMLELNEGGDPLLHEERWDNNSQIVHIFCKKSVDFSHEILCLQRSWPAPAQAV
jgi:hypothetical protein